MGSVSWSALTSSSISSREPVNIVLPSGNTVGCTIRLYFCLKPGISIFLSIVLSCLPIHVTLRFILYTGGFVLPALYGLMQKIKFFFSRLFSVFCSPFFRFALDVKHQQTQPLLLIHSQLSGLVIVPSNQKPLFLFRLTRNVPGIHHI